MVKVVQIADADAPAAEPVPALGFHDAVAGASHRGAVGRENVGAFVNAGASPAPARAPRAAVRIARARRQGKDVFIQVQPVEGGVDFGELLHALHRPGLLVIFPQADGEIVVAGTVPGDQPDHAVQPVVVAGEIGAAVAVQVPSDAAEKADGNGMRVGLVRVGHPRPTPWRYIDAAHGVFVYGPLVGPGARQGSLVLVHCGHHVPGHARGHGNAFVQVHAQRVDVRLAGLVPEGTGTGTGPGFGSGTWPGFGGGRGTGIDAGSGSETGPGETGQQGASGGENRPAQHRPSHDGSLPLWSVPRLCRMSFAFPRALGLQFSLVFIRIVL